VFNKSLIALCACLIATAAVAQDQVAHNDSVGTVESVDGLVTITQGSSGAVAAAGNPVMEGMRFVATSSGSAVIRLNDGCVIKLQPNQVLTVRRDMPCVEALAQFRSGAVATGTLALVSVGLSSVLGNRSISSR
jgi:hypothetical protein